jgi:iron-sulfur cluster assembly protein
MRGMSIQLTPAAARRVRGLMTQPGQEEAKGLRVKVVGGGCSGLSYQIVLDRGPSDHDHVWESEGVPIYCDPKSALFVDGTQIDYHETMMESGFLFQNPKAKGTCGCGTSFTA